MSLLNQASLITTPNAVKEGKLYSIIPSNGNGDMTVVRATTATRVNSAGLIEVVPRNLFEYSEGFTNPFWARLNSTITPNIIASPNGTITADKIVEDTVSITHYVTRSTADYLAGNTYTLSVYAKASERNWVAVGFNNESNRIAWFNLATGVVGTVYSNISSTSIQSVGNGWYRCSVTSTVATTQPYPSVFIAPANGIVSYLGDGVSGIFIWGAQLEQGSTATKYFPTTTRLNIPRINYDSVGGCPSILVEPQRTNLDANSQTFIGWTLDNSGGVTTSAVSTTNPYGFGTVQKVIPNAVLGQHRPLINANYTANGRIWVIAKADGYNFLSLRDGAVVSSGGIIFNLSDGTISGESPGYAASISSLGNGWYKCSVNSNFIGNTLRIIIIRNNNTIADYVGNGTSGILIAHKQLEVGEYDTTSILTNGAIATRNTDVITRNNIYTNNLITSAGGTWFIELNNNFSLPRVGEDFGLWIGDNNTSSLIGNSLFIRNPGGTNRLSIGKCIGSTISGLYATLTNTVKIAIDWNGTTADVFVNGVKVTTATAFPITNMEFLNINGGSIAKYIKSMMLFPKPLTDQECIALTTL